MLKESEKKELLDIARESLEAAVRGQPAPDCKVETEALQGKQGAFVTLKTDGRLRGCLGRFVSDEPLWKTVSDLARASALEDPRFAADRISPDELESVSMEISVLSPLRKSDDPLGEMELGKHGIYITSGGRTGCFLPQVAEETGWNKEEFLNNCCGRKAGLPPDAWRRDPETEVYLFTAEIVKS